MLFVSLLSNAFFLFFFNPPLTDLLNRGNDLFNTGEKQPFQEAIKKINKFERQAMQKMGK
jgi:hypothetical protein